MSGALCDHTSVGMLVVRNQRLLLIERKRFPIGFAPPAGHVDQHGSFEEAARAELREEVGIYANQIDLVFEGRLNNKCRRSGGDWHYWKVFRVDGSGKVVRSSSETKSTMWASRKDVEKLINKTRTFDSKQIDRASWEKSPGLEGVWCDIFDMIGIPVP